MKLPPQQNEVYLKKLDQQHILVFLRSIGKVLVSNFDAAPEGTQGFADWHYYGLGTGRDKITSCGT